MPRPSGSVERRTALDRRHGGRGRIDTLQRHLREVPANLSDFGRELMRNLVQSVPLRATRCYVLDGLYLALTCMNHCFCWSPLEGNMTPVCCCKRHALPLRHMPMFIPGNLARTLGAWRRSV